MEAMSIMAGPFALAVLLLLVIIIGAILGFRSWFLIQKLTGRIETLEKQGEELDQLLRRARQRAAEKKSKSPKSDIPTPQSPPAGKPASRVAKPRPAAELKKEPGRPVFDSVEEIGLKPAGLNILGNITDNWMIWLGGICVGLSGIFLVKYGIEKGMLGPMPRFILGLGTGIGLHGLAEWLRRRSGENHPSFAALAGGASIILYAALLAALHLYQILSPTVAFAGLALISLATMVLALFHGPVLAIIGLLGGYVVPILVSTGSDNLIGAMIYALIISGAALLLMRHVYRLWLWYGMLAGGLGWWLLSFSSFQPEGFRGFYLAILGYMIAAIPFSNWLLMKGEADALAEKTVHNKENTVLHSLVALVLIILAQAVSIGYESFSPGCFLLWGPLVLLVILLSPSFRSFRFLPWLSLLSQWFAWLYCGLDLYSSPVSYVGLGLENQQSFLMLAASMTILYCGGTGLMLYRHGFCHFRASLLCLAPVLWMALGYLLITDLSVNWKWCAAGAMLGTAYLSLASIRLLKDNQDGYGFWLVLAGHFALSLAAAMFFRQATLTLVLATQVLSLTLLIRQFNRYDLGLLVKGVLALIVIRLTTNPWLLQYPADIHWSLWTYGGTFLCCAVAAWLIPQERELRRWLEGAALQLFVLFLAAESRWWLYDGNIFVHDYTLTEGTINTLLWSGLGLVYHYRRRFSHHLLGYYSFCSKVMLAMSLGSYLLVVSVLNPLWTNELVSVTPIWNILLAAYGLPILMAGLVWYFLDGIAKKGAGWFGGVAFFIFISMEIRHLFQPALRLYLPVSDGELYTYSIGWLIMAVTCVLLGARFSKTHVYRAGMGLLLVVIGKIFLVDMSDLQGLLRVASFMGLGLALLGLAYLYQRLTQKDIEN